MFLSIWRFSHLALALSTLLFVLTLSITGAILAFEPIAHAARNLESADKFPERSLGQVIAAVQSEYHEPVSIRVDAQGYLSVSAMTQSGDFVEHYIHPVTAEYAGEIPVQSRWMKNVTTLHRSLFFKTPGRVIVAVTSFLFFLMAVSGIVLVAKRQQGVRNFFRKVIPDGASSFLHVHLGRLLVVPLILIALSGVFLSLLRFDIIPGFFAAHVVNPEAVSDTPALDLSDFPGFNHTLISEVRAVDFPFSKDPQDFYILKLRTKFG